MATRCWPARRCQRTRGACRDRFIGRPEIGHRAALVIDVRNDETKSMSDEDVFGDSVYESGDPVDDTDGLDPIESLTGDDPDEADETGYSPPDREPYNLRHFPTASETYRGESLDEHLAEEEPDATAEEEADLTEEEDLHLTVAEEPDLTFDPDLAEAQPRAGRLVAPDEGVHSVKESEVIARDVGPAGYASSAEEAAVHIVDGEREFEQD